MAQPPNVVQTSSQVPRPASRRFQDELVVLHTFASGEGKGGGDGDSNGGEGDGNGGDGGGGGGFGLSGGGVGGGGDGDGGSGGLGLGGGGTDRVKQISQPALVTLLSVRHSIGVPSGTTPSGETVPQ